MYGYESFKIECKQCSTNDNSLIELHLETDNRYEI